MTRTPSKKKSQSTKNQRTVVLLGVILGGLLLVGAFALLLPRGSEKPTFTPEVSGSPSLKADKEKIDFGDVKLGTPVQASFTLTNVGDATLRFTKEPYVQLAAGC